ncbi:PAAR domain-containing protein [Stenotrophomonas humi]
MGRAFVVVGDRLDHGGSVISGASQIENNGKTVARKGDRAVCSSHGSTTIVSGDASVLIDGQAVARQGDRAAHGATLLASQTSTDVR